MSADAHSAVDGKLPDAIVLRASDENEPTVKEGERRPFRVVNESAVHLSSTTQQVTNAEVGDEVPASGARLGVPVDVELVKARWAWDFDKEERERVVASLREGHRFADVKMILGVDYLGTWATIHMTLAAEPAQAPQPPPPPKGRSFRPAGYLFLGSVVAFVLGMLISSSVGTMLTVAGILGVLFSVAVAFFIVNSNNNARAAANRKWRMEQAEKQEFRQLQRIARTFKDDDLRLFRSAMEEVFKFVVDGIQKRGGEVVQRIEGDRNMPAEPQAAAPAAAPAAEI